MRWKLKLRYDIHEIKLNLKYDIHENKAKFEVQFSCDGG
jgi:hypothetical protein